MNSSLRRRQQHMRRIMAASSMNSIRARLYFDYPPPAVIDSRMCWVLVDLNKCRVVADLASVIKEKFDFSRKTILNLFIEDCYLPPSESVFVVRDNDSIRVKVEGVPLVNGVESISKSESLPWSAKKRDREADEDNEDGRIKKRKKAKAERPEADPHPTRKEEEEEVEKKKKKKKKRKKAVAAAEEEKKNPSVKPPEPVKRTTPAKKPTAPKSKQDKTATKPPAPAAKRRAGSSSSSETSDSSDEEPPKKPTVASVPCRPGGAGATKAVAGAAKAVAVAAAATSSSDDSDSSSPTPASKKTLPPTAKKNPPAPAPVKTAPPAPVPAVTAKAKAAAQGRPESSSSDSDSSSDTGLVIKRPGLGQRIGAPGGWPVSGGVAGRGGENPRDTRMGGSPGAGRGIGRGEGRFPWRGGGPRGGSRGSHGPARGAAAGSHAPHCHSDQNGPQQQQPLSNILTNRAVVLQNPVQSAPKQDYTTMPLLAAPPQVGQRIAFKLLELTENYTPEVSEYKEGKIVGINQSTNQIELELLSSMPAPPEPGKFDLVYETSDGSSVVEYAVSRGSQLTERWESLLEPRLIVDIAV